MTLSHRSFLHKKKTNKTNSLNFFYVSMSTLKRVECMSVKLSTHNQLKFSTMSLVTNASIKLINPEVLQCQIEIWMS